VNSANHASVSTFPNLCFYIEKKNQQVTFLRSNSMGRSSARPFDPHHTTCAPAADGAAVMGAEQSRRKDTDHYHHHDGPRRFPPHEHSDGPNSSSVHGGHVAALDRPICAQQRGRGTSVTRDRFLPLPLPDARRSPPTRLANRWSQRRGELRQ
jgi:hypothetical protein